MWLHFKNINLKEKKKINLKLELKIETCIIIFKAE